MLFSVLLAPGYAEFRRVPTASPSLALRPIQILVNFVRLHLQLVQLVDGIPLHILDLVLDVLLVLLSGRLAWPHAWYEFYDAPPHYR